jgi:hypothetical protein
VKSAAKLFDTKGMGGEMKLKKRYAWVIMKKSFTPLTMLHEACAHEVHLDPNKAEICCRIYEEKATVYNYWVEKVELKSY